MTTLELPGELWEQLVRHAHAALPSEAVGLLGGTAGRVSTAIPLPNLAGSRRFLADPYAQYQAERRLRQQDVHLLAVYHSHPGGGVGLSPLDLDFAAERACLQVVIALDPCRPVGATAAAYEIEAGAPRAVAIEIT